jgi:hypothetical protein
MFSGCSGLYCDKNPLSLTLGTEQVGRAAVL